MHSLEGVLDIGTAIREAFEKAEACQPLFEPASEAVAAGDVAVGAGAWTVRRP